MPKEFKFHNGEPRLTKEVILAACKEREGYSTPRLNDNLFLQSLGVTDIENLEEYTGTKALWLGENAIQRISNISHMRNLRCLFLQTNAIRKIEGLHCLVQIRTLNLSNNMLTNVENLANLTQLHTLELSRNLLSSLADVAHLCMCTSINVLDLAHNRLGDTRIVSVFEAMPLLRVLYLVGNSVVQTISDAWGSYRKHLLARLQALTFLDEKPVDKNERRFSMAWALGGVAGESEERAREMVEREQPNLADRQAAMLAVRQRRRLEIQRIRREMGMPDLSLPFPGEQPAPEQSFLDPRTVPQANEEEALDVSSSISVETEVRTEFDDVNSWQGEGIAARDLGGITPAHQISAQTCVRGSLGFDETQESTSQEVHTTQHIRS